MRFLFESIVSVLGFSAPVVGFVRVEFVGNEGTFYQNLGL